MRPCEEQGCIFCEKMFNSFLKKHVKNITKTIENILTNCAKNTKRKDGIKNNTGKNIQ